MQNGKCRRDVDPKLRNLHISGNHPSQHWSNQTLPKSTAFKLCDIAAGDSLPSIVCWRFCMTLTVALMAFLSHSSVSNAVNLNHGSTVVAMHRIIISYQYQKNQICWFIVLFINRKQYLTYCNNTSWKYRDIFPTLIISVSYQYRCFRLTLREWCVK